MHRPICLALLLLLLPAWALAAPAAGTKGMVAAAHPAAAAAGAEVLRAGGNAVDAAVATAFVLAVVEPYSSGLGGGGFALVRAAGEVSFLDFREVAPAAATPELFAPSGKPDPRLSRDGPLSAGVPGAVAGYLALHEKLGKLPRRRVLEPALRLAEGGFPVDERFRHAVGFRLEQLRADPEASRIFLVAGPKGGPREPPPLGHRLVQPDLAWTLRQLSRDGAAAFYTGELSRRLARDMAERGGKITAADLEAYRVRWRRPLLGSYRGRAIATAPLPSAGGGVVLTLLNALETLPPSTPWHDVEWLHLYLEVSKRAFADRALLGDPAGLADPTAALVAKDRAKRLVERIRQAKGATPSSRVAPAEDARLPAPVPAAPPPDGGPDTTHLCVVDAAGDAVALTTTVNFSWGATIVAKGTGIVWNDEMDDFTLGAGVANTYGIVGGAPNAVAPGRIPLSSMAPTIVFEGPDTTFPVRLVVGSPGGPRIPTTVVQAIVHHLDHGADVQQALGLGRLHHQLHPETVAREAFALEPATAAALAARGHVLEVQPSWSNATAIAVDPASGLRTGAGDPRGVGLAVAQ